MTAETRNAAIAAAIAAAAYFIAERMAMLPSAAEVALKGSAVAILAAAAARATSDRDGWLLAAVMALGALGDVVLEFNFIGGAIAFAIGHVVAISLYLGNRRPGPLPTSQILAAGAILLAAPFLYLMAGPAADAGIALYSGLLAAMAAAAWISRFSRYRTGIGALFFLASDALILGRLGGTVDAETAGLLVWPLYAAGQILIFIGVRNALATRAALSSRA